jgi:Domain of unknown function (DUF4032)
VLLIFIPAVGQAPGLLTLPWERPLADWADERLVEIRQRGISRHVVRFVCDDRPLDALAELLVRLHLSGFFWGDCSLSNALFRYDAGTLEAYLVDAETNEQHAALSKGQRCYDVELAVEQVFGELADLQAGELLPTGVDPLQFAEELAARYKSPWGELTREQVLCPEEQQDKIVERLRRFTELGFDVDEVELVSTRDGSKLRLRTRAASPDIGTAPPSGPSSRRR